MKIFFISIVIGSALAFTLFLSAVLGFWGDFEEIDIETFGLAFTSHIYYTDPDSGDVVELDNLHGEQNRIWVEYSNIPQHVIDAAVAVEDERFFKHKGVDIQRTVSAAVNYIVNKDSSYGGSTITQQLIKNLTGDNETSPLRKVREISHAVNLERKMAKSSILGMYLNTIYLSQGCNGIQSAANTYFGKDVSELTVAEGACIIGITQYPSKFDPIINPEANKEKQEIVLMKMHELGYLTSSEYYEAKNEELEFVRNANTERELSVHSYYIDAVIAEVRDSLINDSGYSSVYADSLIYTGGLRIYTSYNPKVQQAIDDVYRNEENFPKVSGDVKPQSSIVIVDVNTGAVVGLCGGIGNKTGSLTLNRATQTLRQPGSTIKPIAVYAPALDEALISMGSIYDDKPITYGGWTPRNYDYSYRGPVSVKNALYQSYNTVPVQILHQMGVNKAYDFLTKNLGFTTLVYGETRSDGQHYSDLNLSSLALGGLTDGVTVTEMAAAFSAFPNDGIYTKPYLVTKVLDQSNKVLLDHVKSSNIAMKKSTAYAMSQMLNGAVTSGTGRGAAIPNAFTAGKTGTTSDNYDRWFIGYTPSYTAAVWYGYDQPKNLGGGSNPCIPVFRKIMTEIHKDIPYKQLAKPEDVIVASVCLDSGKSPTSLCSQDIRGNRVDTFYFMRGTLPQGTCASHIEIKIDSSTGMLASPYCPTSLITSAVYIKDSIEKEDYNQVCTVHTEHSQGEDRTTTIPDIPTSENPTSSPQPTPPNPMTVPSPSATATTSPTPVPSASPTGGTQAVPPPIPVSPLDN